MKAALAALALWATLSSSGARPAAGGEAVVRVRMAEDGAYASVLLDRPVVTEFRFAAADVERGKDLALLTPGLTLGSDRITGAKPFRRFEIKVRPAIGERDARYPAYYRLGGGGVFYGPALKGDESWRTRMVVEGAPGHVRAPADGSDGFVFVGPKAMLAETAQAVVVSDPSAPVWLTERSRASLLAAVRSFTAALRTPLPRKPVLIVKNSPGAGANFVGDVTAGPVAALRFTGDAWARPDPAAERGIRAFLLHEAFHFWNGGVAYSSDSTPTWLHEGGAEYASLFSGQAADMEDAEGGTRLADALTRCRQGLEQQGNRGLSQLPFLSNQVRYPCGMVIQWAADLHVRRASGGRRTVLDAWGDTIRRARGRPAREYGLADFSAAVGTDASRLAPAALLISQGGAERWSVLPAALNALGADVVETATPETRRSTLLFHLLKENCRALPKGTGFGFYAQPADVRLDSPPGCGVLAGDPTITTVEGGDPLGMTERTYAAVQTKCAGKRPILLVTADRRTLAATCSSVLPDAPKGYEVRRWKQ